MNRKDWIALLLVFLAGFATGWAADRYKNALSWSQRDNADLSAETRAWQKKSTTETTLNTKNEEVEKNAQHELESARRDRGLADNAADRLRAEIDGIRGKLRESNAARDTAVDGQRQATARYAVMLADVLERADKRAGELAAVADDNRIRGLTCERQYEALRQALK